jgi:radical SAM superfamily enzyme YgiQ (UPF0313 family)
MKVLLIYPYFLEQRIQAEDISVVPIGLYYVATVLRDYYYEVEILNWHHMNNSADQIKAFLGEKSPDVIGFSILNGNRWGGIEIARIAKELDPKTTVVFGGAGATFLWEHFLTHFPEIDYVVIGEGEYAFLELMKCIETKAHERIENLKAIAFRKDGRPVKANDCDLIPVPDELPIPAKYYEYRHLSSTRGCAWKCKFCGSPGFWGQKIRFRSPQNFVEEVELLHKKGVTFFYVSDDTFTIDKERAVKICKRIIERKLQIAWNAISRVEHVDDEILYWMRRAGCIQISYGVESGSETIRRMLNKPIKTDQIKKAFALTTRHGILPRAYFIYGSPGETWETVQETIDLIHEIKPLSIVFHILDLFPGTELYSDLKTNSNLTDDIYLKRIEGIMYSETDPALSDELMLAFGQRLRDDFYENIHTFADSISLIDDKELYQMHADFCSRLGMTFSHGDYSKIEAVKDKDRIAEKLFRKSLSYHPNHRAYLGLGIIKQKNRAYEESIEVLSEGVKYFPKSEQLNSCLGISHMNLGDYKAALSFFLKFPNSKLAKDHIARCRGSHPDQKPG